MKSFLFVASALTLATPVFAQTTPPAPAATPPATTSSSTSVTTPMANGTAATTTTTAPAPAAAPPAQTPDQILAAEFPTYDKDGNKTLSRAEFDTWMTALQAKGGQKLTAAQLKTWLNTSFTKADADKSSSVSLAELTTFLATQQG